MEYANTTQAALRGCFCYTDKHEVMRRGQSAGQENRAGERNVPAGAEVG